MADLAVGLSKSVVAGAITKVQSAIQDDARFRQKAQHDLVTITLEFEMMNSFLNVATEETTKDKLVMTWVRHVRELAYDLEDCVEFILHLDSKPIFWHRMLPSFMIASSPLPLDQAVMEIEQLKGRAEELSKCYMRYSHISESASKLVMQQQPTRGAALSVTEFNMIAEARDAAWRKQDSTDLNQLILKKDDARLGVISLWGTGGYHGTTSIIRKAYRDPQICEKFLCRAWIKLMHPFNPEEFIRSFMSQVYANDCRGHGADVGVHVLSKMKARQDLLQEFVEKVNNNTYLVVLEDLTHMVDWDTVRTFLPDMKNGSCIIVSTQQLEMASLCAGRSCRILELKQFTADHSICALFKVQRKVPLISALKYLKHVELDELILKCGGLPTVIVAIAGLLASTPVNKLMDTIRSLNSRFIHHLETNPEFGSLRGLFEWMHSVILNPPDFLKPCIFYLTIFPPNHIIRRRRLVRRWIAEGYSRGSVETQADDNGEMFFSELLELSIFQQVSDIVTTVKRMGFYQVNGLIREYIISRRMEENLVLELGGRGAPLKSQNTGRHLIILECWKREQIVFEHIDVSRLRSLTVFGKWQSFFISKTMNLLRVLDLEDASGVNDVDLEKMMKLLHRLKFLSVRGCRDICHLPSSLGDMRQLQTLDVRGTSIHTLPMNISKCHKLQYIRAGCGITIVRASTPADSSCLPRFRRSRHPVGVLVPGDIGKLAALHTLGVINVGASGIKKELKHLTQLRKLGVSGINKHNNKNFFSAISSHDHLESLSVQLDKANQDCLNGTSLPCQNLQSLKLYGFGDQLPLSRSHLSKLRKLDLEMGTLREVDIQFLANLPELCILRLCVKQLHDGTLRFYAELCGCELLAFEKVKILEIDCSSSRLHVIFASKSMRNLELLTLDCSSVSYKVTGLDDLSELKQVMITGTNDETIKRNLESQLVRNPKRPTVKLQEVPRSPTS